MQILRKSKSQGRYYTLFMLLAAAYAVMTVLAPAAANPYRLSPNQLLTLRLSIVLPVILIWGFGIYGATTFKKYALGIKNSPDGRAFNTIASGVLCLIFGLILASLFSALANYLGIHHHLRTIINNYLLIMVPFISYYLVMRGAIDLIDLIPSSRRHVRRSFIMMLAPFLLLASIYVSLIFNTVTTRFAGGVVAPYYLAPALLWGTIVVPYLLTWAIGIFCAAMIRTYAQFTKGILYKRALAYLVQGILALVTFSIFLQLITSLNHIFAGWNLTGILVLLFVLILLYSVGFVLLAAGAKKLNKIEGADE